MQVAVVDGCLIVADRRLYPLNTVCKPTSHDRTNDTTVLGKEGVHRGIRWHFGPRMTAFPSIIPSNVAVQRVAS
jgi:hypothetical protein